jgi:hypothetical protein
MSDDENMSDLKVLNGKIIFPATIMFSPFSLFAVNMEFPATFLLIFFSIYDFFISRDGTLAKKYIVRFKLTYGIFFLSSLIIRLIWFFTDENIIKLFIILLIFFAFIYWIIFFWRGWNKLIVLSNSNKNGHS